jgi:uncharacterized protein (TIGR02466 family)
MSNKNLQVAESYFFPTTVYKLEASEYLEPARAVAADFLKQSENYQKNINDLYPVRMTDNVFNDPRIAELTQMIAQLSWDILNAQGYAMENLQTVFSSMWVQEHYKYSLMEQHAHGDGSQIVGFYFLDVPENSTTRLVLFDPRPAKVQINLPEKIMMDVSYGSNMVNFEPKAGDLFFTNAWLPHSFTRNGSEKPVRFIHFNIGVVALPQQYPAPVGPEII